MDHSSVQAWLDAYIEAWRENRPELVQALFTDDAVYRFRPYGGEGRVVSGIEEIATSWIDESGDSGKWQAEYRPYAVDGDKAVATGTSRYFLDDGTEEIYHNCFLLRFGADGRCCQFTEYWMLEPTDERP